MLRRRLQKVTLFWCIAEVPKLNVDSIWPTDMPFCCMIIFSMQMSIATYVLKFISLIRLCSQRKKCVLWMHKDTRVWKHNWSSVSDWCNLWPVPIVMRVILGQDGVNVIRVIQVEYILFQMHEAQIAFRSTNHGCFPLPLCIILTKQESDSYMQKW